MNIHIVQIKAIHSIGVQRGAASGLKCHLVLHTDVLKC